VGLKGGICDDKKPVCEPSACRLVMGSRPSEFRCEKAELFRHKYRQLHDYFIETEFAE